MDACNRHVLQEMTVETFVPNDTKIFHDGKFYFVCWRYKLKRTFLWILFSSMKLFVLVILV